MVQDKMPALPGEMFHQRLYIICKHYGLNRVHTLKETLHSYGVTEGEKLRKEVEVQGQELTLENFLQHNHYIEAYSGHIQKLIDQEILEIWQPLSEEIAHQVLLAYSLLLCEFHKGMLQGYNSTLTHSYSGCIMLGSHSCQLVSKLSLH